MSFFDELRANPFVTHFAKIGKDDRFEKTAAIIFVTIALVSAVGAYLLTIAPPDAITIPWLAGFSNWVDLAFTLPVILFSMLYMPLMAALSAVSTASIIGGEEFQTLRLTLVKPRQLAIGLMFTAYHRRRLLVVLSLSLIVFSILKSVAVFFTPGISDYNLENVWIISFLLSAPFSILAVIVQTVLAVAVGALAGLIFRSNTLAVILAAGMMFTMVAIRFVVLSSLSLMINLYIARQGTVLDETVRTMSTVAFIFSIVISLLGSLSYLGMAWVAVKVAEYRAERF